MTPNLLYCEGWEFLFVFIARSPRWQTRYVNFHYNEARYFAESLRLRMMPMLRKGIIAAGNYSPLIIFRYAAAACSCLLSPNS